MIGLKCPGCGKINIDTRDHLEANWDQLYTCDGCGEHMRLDREEALSILDKCSDGSASIIPMHEVS
jgi:hypothetical protein